jgi:hypothetical protein
VNAANGLVADTVGPLYPQTRGDHAEVGQHLAQNDPEPPAR